MERVGVHFVTRARNNLANTAIRPVSVIEITARDDTGPVVFREECPAMQLERNRAKRGTTADLIGQRRLAHKYSVASDD